MTLVWYSPVHLPQVRKSMHCFIPYCMCTRLVLRWNGFSSSGDEFSFAVNFSRRSLMSSMELYHVCSHLLYGTSSSPRFLNSDFLMYPTVTFVTPFHTRFYDRGPLIGRCANIFKLIRNSRITTWKREPEQLGLHYINTTSTNLLEFFMWWFSHDTLKSEFNLHFYRERKSLDLNDLQVEMYLVRE